MPSLTDRLALEVPILQAGMGGGIDGHALAAAVSEGGGLGTIGMLDPGSLREELERARGLTGKPLAVNLLLPFARDRHWQIAQEADAVVAQGVEAGGHVRGTERGLELLERIRAALPGYPVLLAGGVASAADVRRALDAGAVAVLAGTRFLLTEESGAHPEYKRRLLGANRTVLTELFGLGWPGRHRVVANAATERWLGDDGRAPSLVRAVHRLSAPAISRLPLAAAARLSGFQNARLPLFGPSAPIVSSPDSLVDVAPLYAGETVARITELRPAGQLVRELAG